MDGMQDTLLEARHIRKIYSRHSSVSRKRIAKDFWRALLRFGNKRDAEIKDAEFWALKDIDLTLKRGEAVGIIGLNGSGKTTLLRVLAGQIVPDGGTVRVWGETASMIDLTAGFEPSASGRRNIFLRSAALGRSSAQAAACVDEIIEFSELGDAIEAPVATYSSGMQMRLAFAIMMATSPEVLFIDEVLAVGDFRFRQKCLARLRDIRDRSSFVMVSHSMADIRTFCSRVIVLNKGQEVFSGEPDEAIEVYESLEFSDPVDREAAVAKQLSPQFENSSAIQNFEGVWCDQNGHAIESALSGQPVCFKLSFTMTATPRRPVIGIPVWSDDGVYATGFSTELAKFKPQIKEGEKYEVLLEIPHFVFNPGTYVSNTGIMDGPEFLYRKANAPLTILPQHKQTWGVVTLQHSWKELRK